MSSDVVALIGVFILFLTVLVPFIFIGWWWKKRKFSPEKLGQDYEKLLLDIKEKEKVLLDIKLNIKQEKVIYDEVKERNKKELEEDLTSIKEYYNAQINDLKLELSKLESELESEHSLRNIGLYVPTFKLGTSIEYREKIKELIEKQKSQVKSGVACICGTKWTVGEGKNAKKLGEAMTKDNISMALMAFNNECNALIARVDHRNFERTLDKMKMSFERINKLNERNDVKLTMSYLFLKEQELRATYEYILKKEQEREEQARINAEIAEERKAQQEFERAKREALKEQKAYEKEIEQARKLLEKDKENQELLSKLAELEGKLKEAEEKGQRAISQAQLTKSGYVYVISNIGSFGENVYKIGMTRRLEPMDRVRELGDASVPFPFDVHALIFSDNAPELEAELHRTFANKQVNRVNTRKEFFKVELKEIAEIAKKYDAKVEFTMLAEAYEYRQSLLLEKENKYSAVEEYDDEVNE